MEDKQLEKRKYHYIMSPTSYSVSGCTKCDGNNTTWSEYVDHLWCFDCEIDFIPEHIGIFDGPIGIGAATLLGISFDRVEIATGKIIKFGTPEYDHTRP